MTEIYNATLYGHYVAKYLSAGVNSLGKGNEFRRRESRVNSFLGMGNYCNQVSTINTTQNAK